MNRSIWKRLVACILLIVTVLAVDTSFAVIKINYCSECGSTRINTLQLNGWHTDNKDGSHTHTPTVIYTCYNCSKTWGPYDLNPMTQLHTYVKQSYDKSKKKDFEKCSGWGCGATRYVAHTHNIKKSRTFGWSKLGFWKITEECTECDYKYVYFKDGLDY